MALQCQKLFKVKKPSMINYQYKMLLHAILKKRKEKKTNFYL
jgi:hypothetical protein